MWEKLQDSPHPPQLHFRDRHVSGACKVPCVRVFFHCLDTCLLRLGVGVGGVGATTFVHLRCISNQVVDATSHEFL